jgi:hypothetical protein
MIYYFLEINEKYAIALYFFKIDFGADYIESTPNIAKTLQVNKKYY